MASGGCKCVYSCIVDIRSSLHSSPWFTPFHCAAAIAHQNSSSAEIINVMLPLHLGFSIHSLVTAQVRNRRVVVIVGHVWNKSLKFKKRGGWNKHGGGVEIIFSSPRNKRNRVGNYYQEQYNQPCGFITSII